MLNPISTTETLRLIRCGIADETYGLDMSWVRSIQRMDRLRRNPEVRDPSTSPRHSPVGWLPVNEGEVPVFSLASRLAGSSEEGGALQRVVVLNPSPSLAPAKGIEEGQPWALLVDRVSQVIQVPADRVVPLPPIVINPSANYFKGVIELGEELILFLSPERLHPNAPLDASGPVREAADPRIRSPKLSAGGQRRNQGQIMIYSTTAPQPGERALSFGLSLFQVPEILAPLPLVPVPAAPAFVLGLVNWRTRPVPVVDLDARLGLASQAKPSANGRTRLIITRDKGGGNQGLLGGFLVRPAIRVLRLPIAHQSCNRTPPLDQTLIRGVVELENETLVIPNIRSILRHQDKK